MSQLPSICTACFKPGQSQSRKPQRSTFMNVAADAIEDHNALRVGIELVFSPIPPGRWMSFHIQKTS